VPGAGSRSLLEASAAYPCSVRLPSALDATIARYRHLEIEYAALRVVGRGLFLAVMLMLAFLYVFTRITDILTGVNEVLVPTLTVAPDVDLGALAQGAFSRTSASVIGALSALTLAASALLSGKALLDGTQRALLGEAAGRTSLLGARTILVAIILSVTIFLSWLVTLATSIRQRAWVQLLGRDPQGQRFVPPTGRRGAAPAAGCGAGEGERGEEGRPRDRPPPRLSGPDSPILRHAATIGPGPGRDKLRL